MRDNVEVIESVWEAFGRGDVEKAAAAVAEKGEIVSPQTLPWGGTYLGPEGFKDFLASLTAEFRDFKARAVKVLGADDNHVAVVAETSGRTKSGKALEVQERPCRARHRDRSVRGDIVSVKPSCAMDS